MLTWTMDLVNGYVKLIIFCNFVSTISHQTNSIEIQIKFCSIQLLFLTRVCTQIKTVFLYATGGIHGCEEIKA